jgi:hypothetical protein
MTERQIQDTLYPVLTMRGQRHICPNYTPRKWFECDMFSITCAGYMVEHEIKLTLSDFKADEKKEFKPGWWQKDAQGQKKHDMLAAGSTFGPSRFFYVVPSGLVKVSEVPDWAGLINVFGFFGDKGLRTEIAKHAPRLHKKQVDEEVIKHVEGIFYWRFWNHRMRREVQS